MRLPFRGIFFNCSTLVLALALASWAPAVSAQTVRTLATGVVVRIAEGPRINKFVEPTLPSREQKIGGEQAGSVQVEVFIRPDGWVAGVQLVKTNDSSFWGAAERALKQWRYDPASLAGLGSPAHTSVTIEFPLPPPHNSGAVLAETDLYRVTASSMRAEWCFQLPDRSQANVNVIWRVRPEEDLTGATAAYQQRLAEIWREIEKHCNPTTSAFISNYVAGVRMLATDNTEVEESVALQGSESEAPVNNLMVSKDPASGKITIQGLVDSPSYASLAAARERRKPPRIIALATPRAMSAANAQPVSASAPAPTVSASAPAPTPTPATSSPTAAAPVTRTPPPPLAPPPASIMPPLDVSKLGHGDLIRTIYLGRFDLAPLMDSRNLALITDQGIVGRKLFASYVESFSDSCPGSLSARKVAIKRTITTREQRVNGRGIVFDERETGSRTEDTGIFVEPELAQAYVGIGNSGGFEALVALWRDLGSKGSSNLAEASVKLLREMLEIGMEMREVISRHGCDSPQVKRFARNALAYVTLQSPQTYDGFSYYCASQLPAYVPGAAKSACGCIKNVLRQDLAPSSFYALEDDFTEQRFLSSVISKVGLHDKVAACVR
jgi:hypothetical protein